MVLRRRGAHTEAVVELIVNGAFVMDTVDVSTEIALASHTLARHPAPRRVLVGGLGLGFTAQAVLDDPRVEQVTVVEIAEPLIAWADAGMLPGLGMRGAPSRDDARLSLVAEDVGEFLQQAAGEWDLVLLDVDNGPGFLVRDANADLYAAPGLAYSMRALRPAGILAIWSSHRSPALLTALQSLAHHQGRGDVEEVLRPVHREGRDFEYAIYLLVT